MFLLKNLQLYLGVGTCIILLVFLLIPVTAVNNTTPAEALAKVEVPGDINQVGLPIYAHLLGMDGHDYVLVKASPSSLAASGLNYTILDPNSWNATYAIASRYTSDTHQEISGFATVLFDDGRHLILKTDRNATRALLAAGLEINWLKADPIVIREPGISVAKAARAINYDSRIAGMLSLVSRDFLNSSVASLSGEQKIPVGGNQYTILTRDTDSGDSINKATQYAYEYLQGRNLTVSYNNWNKDGYSCRNVIGTKTGTVRPGEIVLVTAHIDSYSRSGNAPGADDDASGSAAVLQISDIMKTYQFERTVRFVLFTGEEQGMLGSEAYADAVKASGENITAVINMDMIAWSSDSSHPIRLHTRQTSDPSGYAADMVIAGALNQSVYLYGLKSNLTPVFTPDGETASDHDSFWNNGYPAILAIEDDYDDFNPYYHSSNDRLTRLNMNYYISFVKASLATAAHLAYLVGPAPVLPVANFTANLTGGSAPLTVQFNDKSSGNPTAWNWSFGDGTWYNTTIEASRNTTRTYVTAGNYTVRLLVSNSAGRNTTMPGTNITVISVDPTPPRTVTNLTNTTYLSSSIRWTWTDPTDADFDRVIVWLDGKFKTNITRGDSTL